MIKSDEIPPPGYRDIFDSFSLFGRLMIALTISLFSFLNEI
jgi:hypothetical protein